MPCNPSTHRRILPRGPASVKADRVSFCCPQCRATLLEHAYAAAGERILTGELECPCCGRGTPVVQGFPLFGETGPAPVGPEKLAALAARWFRTRSEIEEFVHRQSIRPVFDAYAAYYPFNEALVGFVRFRDLVLQRLEPGNLILDLSCRTGWIGEFLAALFPDQYVVSLWEGNQGVLAYSGYAYWLPESSRARNLEIVFTPDRARLPFEDGAFGLVFGYDYLHRHVDRPSLQELLRVASAGAPLIFPHVHTNHSLPDPYFEREGTLMSSADWCRRWSSIPGNGARTPCVISELATYGAQAVEIATPDPIEHYNCCVLLVPEHWLGRQLAPPRAPVLTGDEYLFLNPLLEVDPSSGIVSIDPASMDGGVAHLLQRHPAIGRDLEAHIARRLNRPQRQFLFWADKGLDYSQACRRMENTDWSPEAEIRDLVDRRILLALPVSEAMWELQHYYRHRLPVYPVREHVFSTLWRNMAARYAGHPVMINHDGSEFGLEDTRLLVQAVRALLSSREVGSGDRLLIASAGHLEVLITCWAAWLDGIVVAVIDPRTGPDGIRGLLREINARLAFADSADTVPGDTACDVITFDDMSSGVRTGTSFSARIEPFMGASIDEPDTPPSEDAAALVLCTSGSSGTPKKVELSHGSLFRTGDMLARLHHWNRGERLLSLGPVHSMSGLRNPAVAALHSGATIVVPSPNERAIATSALRAIERHAVNIVTTVPAFLENIDRLLQQGRTLELPSLRLLLTTASPTDAAAQQRVSKSLGINVADYYGLTETGGLCIAQQSGRQYTQGVIGRPTGCICEIRDQAGNPVAEGEPGELHIYSDNLMTRYLGDPLSGLRVHEGWLATGDLARLLDGGDIELLGRLDRARKNRQGEFISQDVER